MGIINEDSIDKALDDMTRLARKECRKRGMKDHQDIAQQAFEKAWREDQAGRLDVFEEVGPRTTPIFARYVKAAANKEYVDYMYFSGAYLYNRPTVVHILENLAWGEPSTISEAEAKVDVVRAYENLSEGYRIVLYKKYALGITPKGGSAEQRAMSRAIDALTRNLNFATERHVREADVSGVYRNEHGEPALGYK